ncbi:MAG: phosphoribosylglycinamide formyltransferase 2 [Piscirickettsiaceae bacterium CG_4_9_14_3_um_filter_43_564]|nr:formate-dependent phosphoribosylglycinamide formyltransferase [Thiomicrospira sp.]OIP94405.1 MAG: phosphoribosylglycinamide formyltransferase 2 [Thiomicrospira sp. CG2_30_44_34]PIQ05255.1 MAG: phosphoribosylglycinamide formyltransferase 2 [Piscirickettsiaceae bacterium CG18_big_fil_WC_8_21_14_2_50_44_103]PIU39429.1 MAG: phosphoribosylglycinamide formyltransferase 2 [Piscirickettsiaceae bacterium CG07_land_8_20_14_0_80_44_28]PIW57782.1 MAG: phosphoribosylglycinamide formyltransferase 2 [Pisci
MLQIGTPFSNSATKILLCGAGELGKEVAIEAQRFGMEVIALDRYENAPAMQVADRSYTLSMLDGQALRAIIEAEKPHYIVPEIEAIATDTLVALETEGYNIVPCAKATQLTMNREGIRRLAAETLGIPTSRYLFADTFSEFSQAVQTIGMPCVIKPIMSSSGKGQSLIKSIDDIETAWRIAQEGGRAGKGKVIVEGFVDFDYEITLLTIRHKNGTAFCDPIGHIQQDGDYQQSWQPHPMTLQALESAQAVAQKITQALSGWGLFGVELFVKGDDIIFSEVSPRPHDTGLVTLISQDLSEFALHLRAMLGLPIPNISQLGPSASSVILPSGHSTKTAFTGLEAALAEPNTQLRLFGKPDIAGRRRMGVALAKGQSLDDAIQKAKRAAAAITTHY